MRLVSLQVLEPEVEVAALDDVLRGQRQAAKLLGLVGGGKRSKGVKEGRREGRCACGDEGAHVER